ncbi:MAG: hypothetical protein LRY66_03055 [Saccharospirillaceae bacterium]|nr:hypothetical protein [Saccharospirillaceae bacterium]
MRVLLSLLVFVSLTGCAATQEIFVQQPPAYPVADEKMPTAGAVSVDITPPPGMPMGGLFGHGEPG